MKKQKILIGIPAGSGKLSAGLAHMLHDAGRLNQEPDHPFCYELAIAVGYRPVDRARNILCRRALEINADKILMIDEDMRPPWNWWALLLHDEPIVSGVMYGWGKPLGKGMRDLPETQEVILLNVAYNLADDNSYYSVPVDVGAPFHCDAVGGANFVIRRDVLDKIPRPWFRTVYDDDDDVRVVEGEDMAFCRKAGQIGIRPLLDPRVRFGHEKTVDLNDVAKMTIVARGVGLQDALSMVASVEGAMTPVASRGPFEKRNGDGPPAHLWRAAATGLTGECEMVEFLYQLVRTLKPKRALEIGSGITTRAIAEAMRDNAYGRLTSIDNSPPVIESARMACQDLPVDLALADSRFWASTEAFDLVFIDSGHGPERLQDLLRFRRNSRGLVVMHDTLLYPGLKDSLRAQPGFRCLTIPTPLGITIGQWDTEEDECQRTDERSAG